MPNFFINNNFYQGTGSVAQPVIVEDSLTVRAGFSINASNQIEGTAWVVKNGQHLKSGLGTLSFSILDKDSVAVGISASGIVANAGGYYKVGPFAANAIQDLTHYTVELLASQNGEAIDGVVLITLGE